MKKNQKLFLGSGIATVLLAAGLAVVMNLPSDGQQNPSTDSSGAVLLYDKTAYIAEDIMIKNESGEFELLGYDYSDMYEDVSDVQQSDDEISFEVVEDTSAEGSEDAPASSEGSESSRERSYSGLDDPIDDSSKPAESADSSDTEQSDTDEEEEEPELYVQYTMQEYDSEILSKTMTDSLNKQCCYMSATRIVDKSGSRYAEYGLDSPRATVDITFSDASAVTLYIGNDAPAESGVYLRKEGDQNVYLVLSNMVNMFLVDKLQYIDKAISRELGEKETVQSITISGSHYDEEISIIAGSSETTECDYRITKPRREICDKDVAEDYAYLFYNLCGTTVVAAQADSAQRSKYGLDDPYMNVKIVTDTGYTVNVLASKADDSGKCYIMSGYGTVIFEENVADLSWYDMHYEEFLSKVMVYPNMQDIEEMTISQDGRDDVYTFKRQTVINSRYEDSISTTVFCNDKKVDNLNIVNFVCNLIGVERSPDKPESLDGAQEVLSVRFSYQEGAYTSTFQFYRAESGQLFAVLNGEIECYVGSAPAEDIIKQAQLVPGSEQIELLVDYSEEEYEVIGYYYDYETDSDTQTSAAEGAE